MKDKKAASLIPDNPRAAMRSQPGLDFGYTGQSPARMAEEALAILALLKDGGFEPVSDKESEFVANMYDKAASYGKGMKVTGAQLTWLRDIRDRSVK